MRTPSAPAAALVFALAVAAGAHPTAYEPVEIVPPPGFVPPPLHPEGVSLETLRLAPGVYALVSDRPPVDNGGFIVGEDGVLVIDSHISPEMGQRIIDAVRAVTEKPIRYLVNTNYHGDHTFGNSAFPRETLIIAHTATREATARFEQEKGLMLNLVNQDSSVLESVTLRQADMTFEESMTIDLGGRVVEIHHFGHGNTPGDTVVYEPLSRTAWTGNLVMGEGVIPFVLEGGAGVYMETLARFSAELTPERIIPGHGVPTTGAQLARHIDYLGELLVGVKQQIAQGRTHDQTLKALPLGDRWLPAAGSPLEAVRPVIERGFHPYNVSAVYRDLTRE